MQPQDDAARAFLSLVTWHPHNAVTGVRRIATMKEAGEEMTSDEWRGFVYERFPKLLGVADTCMSVVSQLLISDVHNPFALIVVDEPATGKTICLNFFKGIDEIVYSTSDFTPASFVSSMAGKSEKQLEKIDLLPKIRYKTLIVKDLAPIMSDQDDVLRKRLGMMIDILDGEGYTTQSGTHGSRGYDGDYLFMMLAASTHFAPRVWKVMSEYGPRLNFIGLHSDRPTIDDLVWQMDDVGYKTREKECRTKTHAFLRHLWKKNANGVEWDRPSDDKDVKRRIAQCAQFLSYFRGDIYVHEERGTSGKVMVSTIPRIEFANRISSLLYNLARGHAVWNGRNFLTQDDLGVVIRVMLDSAPNPRPKVLRLLLRADGKITVDQVMTALRISRQTAKKEMHKLVQLNICDGAIEQEEDQNEAGIPVAAFGQAKTTITLRDEYRWLLTPLEGYAEIWREQVTEWAGAR